MVDEFCPHCMSKIGRWLDDPLLTLNGAKYAYETDKEGGTVNKYLYEVKAVGDDTYKNRIYKGVVEVKVAHIEELQEYFNSWEEELDLPITEFTAIPDFSLEGKVAYIDRKYITELRDARLAILTKIGVSLSNSFICDDATRYIKKYNWNSFSETYTLSDQTAYRTSVVKNGNVNFLDIEDLRHPIPYAKYLVEVPETTDNGVFYTITVSCVDVNEEVITSYNGTATIATSYSTGSAPSQLKNSEGTSVITFTDGVFTGQIKKIAETFAGPPGNLTNYQNIYYNVCAKSIITANYPLNIVGFSTTFGYGYHTVTSAMGVLYDCFMLQYNHIQPPTTADTGQWKYNWDTFPNYEEHIISLSAASSAWFRHDGSALAGSGDKDENLPISLSTIKASQWEGLNHEYDSMQVYTGSYESVYPEHNSYFITYIGGSPISVYVISGSSPSGLQRDYSVASNCIIYDPTGVIPIQMPTRPGVYTTNRELVGNTTTMQPPMKEP